VQGGHVSLKIDILKYGLLFKFCFSLEFIAVQQGSGVQAVGWSGLVSIG
jgi:hypothetical protein